MNASHTVQMCDVVPESSIQSYFEDIWVLEISPVRRFGDSANDHMSKMGKHGQQKYYTLSLRSSFRKYCERGRRERSCVPAVHTTLVGILLIWPGPCASSATSINISCLDARTKITPFVDLSIVPRCSAVQDGAPVDFVIQWTGVRRVHKAVKRGDCESWYVENFIVRAPC